MCAIRYNTIELEPREIDLMIKSPGLSVKSSAGHQYFFCDKPDGETCASISGQQTQMKFDGESDDEQHQRIAVTVMNMIDNVLAKKNVIDIKTDDAFIAEIARKYIAYLKLSCGIQIEVLSISTPNDPQKMETAGIIFQELSHQLEGIEKNPALKAYVERNRERIEAARDMVKSMKNPMSLSKGSQLMM